MALGAPEFASFPTKQVGYTRQLAIVFCLVVTLEKKIMSFQQSLVLSSSRSWGCGLSRRGRVRERRDALPSPGPVLRGGHAHFNRELCQKTRFAGKERPGPLFLPAGSSAAFPVTQGSEKAKANIYFPLSRIKISHPAQSHYPFNVRTGSPVFRKSTREGQFFFFILKMKIPFQMMTCFQEAKC